MKKFVWKVDLATLTATNSIESGETGKFVREKGTVPVMDALSAIYSTPTASEQAFRPQLPGYF